MTLELRAVSAPDAIATEVPVVAEEDSIDVTGLSEASVRQRRTPTPAPLVSRDHIELPEQ